MICKSLLATASMLGGLMMLNSPALAASPPVYVHMNGANMFLENVVAVKPGEKVVFINEDTGDHTIIGYNPATGAASKTFNGYVAGTKGPNDKIASYTISFPHTGIVDYYCSVHADLAKEPDGMTMPKVRKGVDGFGDPMAGIIIVTTDPHILAENPKSSAEKILPDYFGG